NLCIALIPGVPLTFQIFGSGLLAVWLCDIVRVDTSKKGTVADIQQLGRFSTVPERMLQRFLDKRPLGRLDGLPRRIFPRYTAPLLPRRCGRRRDDNDGTRPGFLRRLSVPVSVGLADTSRTGRLGPI